MKRFVFSALIFGFSVAGTAADAEEGASLVRADELGGSLAGSVAFTTEYISRGLSNTRPGVPAIQSNLEFDHDSGAYAGVWGSNVKMAPPNQSASVELDWSAGLRGNLTDKAKYDLGATYFNYPGANRPDGLDFEYYELYAKGTYDFGFVVPYLHVNYSPDYQFDSGAEWYLVAGATAPLGRYLKLTFHVGREIVRDNVRFGVRDYWDYSAGLGTNVAGLDVALDYVTNDLKSNASGLGSCGTSACDRVVLTVTKTF